MTQESRTSLFGDHSKHLEECLDETLLPTRRYSPALLLSSHNLCTTATHNSRYAETLASTSAPPEHSCQNTVVSPTLPSCEHSPPGRRESQGQKCHLFASRPKGEAEEHDGSAQWQPRRKTNMKISNLDWRENQEKVADPVDAAAYAARSNHDKTSSTNANCGGDALKKKNKRPRRRGSTLRVSFTEDRILTELRALNGLCPASLVALKDCCLEEIKEEVDDLAIVRNPSVCCMKADDFANCTCLLLWAFMSLVVLAALQLRVFEIFHERTADILGEASRRYLSGFHWFFAVCSIAVTTATFCAFSTGQFIFNKRLYWVCFLAVNCCADEVRTEVRDCLNSDLLAFIKYVRKLYFVSGDFRRADLQKMQIAVNAKLTEIQTTMDFSRRGKQSVREAVHHQTKWRNRLLQIAMFVTPVTLNIVANTAAIGYVEYRRWYLNSPIKVSSFQQLITDPLVSLGSEGMLLIYLHVVMNSIVLGWLIAVTSAAVQSKALESILTRIKAVVAEVANALLLELWDEVVLQRLSAFVLDKKECHTVQPSHKMLPHSEEPPEQTSKRDGREVCRMMHNGELFVYKVCRLGRTQMHYKWEKVPSSQPTTRSLSLASSLLPSTITLSHSDPPPPIAEYRLLPQREEQTSTLASGISTHWEFCSPEFLSCCRTRGGTALESSGEELDIRKDGFTDGPFSLPEDTFRLARGASATDQDSEEVACCALSTWSLCPDVKDEAEEGSAATPFNHTALHEAQPIQLEKTSSTDTHGCSGMSAEDLFAKYLMPEQEVAVYPDHSQGQSWALRCNQCDCRDGCWHTRQQEQAYWDAHRNTCRNRCLRELYGSAWDTYKNSSFSPALRRSHLATLDETVSNSVDCPDSGIASGCVATESLLATATEPVLRCGLPNARGEVQLSSMKDPAADGVSDAGGKDGPECRREWCPLGNLLNIKQQCGVVSEVELLRRSSEVDDGDKRRGPPGVPLKASRSSSFSQPVLAVTEDGNSCASEMKGGGFSSCGVEPPESLLTDEFVVTLHSVHAAKGTCLVCERRSEISRIRPESASLLDSSYGSTRAYDVV